MATTAIPGPKPEKIERAIQKVMGQLNKDATKRVYTPAAHAALITYIVNEHGVKIPADVIEALRRDLMDSDVQYTSNMRAYLGKRNLIAEKPQADAGTFAP
jgi:LDH2 family malate/lactate/ureidoglycolate dehydrogenase